MEMDYAFLGHMAQVSNEGNVLYFLPLNIGSRDHMVWFDQFWEFLGYDTYTITFEVMFPLSYTFCLIEKYF